MKPLDKNETGELIAAIHSLGKDKVRELALLMWQHIHEQEAANSPVIPDGWVACSERMPGEDEFVLVWPLPDFGVELHVGQYCEGHLKGDGWYAQVYEQNYGIEWYPINVTHWHPLPSPPTTEK